MSEWIKCSERMPDDGFRGLCVLGFYGEPSRFQMILTRRGDKWLYEIDFNDGGEVKEWEVKYWMPLPAPPPDQGGET